MLLHVLFFFQEVFLPFLNLPLNLTCAVYCALIIPIVLLSLQEEEAEYQKYHEDARENAKRCDYPPCNASAADKNMNNLYKCPRCNEGRYCCHVHGNLDWDRHKLLCRDIPYTTGVKL